VRQRWRQRSPGGAGELVVETTARLSDAAGLRRFLAERPRPELMEERRKVRVRALEVELTATGLEWTDDEEQDVLVVREHYSVPHVYDADSRLVLNTLAIGDDLERVRKDRREPFALSHPTRVHETIEFEFDRALLASQFELKNRTVSHPAFALAVKQSLAGDTLTLEWDYETRRDRVLPEELGAYRAALDDALGDLDYQLTAPGPAAGPQQAASAAPRPASRSGGAWVIVVPLTLVLVAGFLRLVNRGEKPASNRRARRFRAALAASPGELATEPASVASMDEARRFFRTGACPAGHPWREELTVSGSVRVGEARVTVVERRCSACEAKEHRYVTLRS
jgi:hypothetical protein